MIDRYEMNVIAHIRSDFSTKFGIPRQSGLVRELRSELIFEPAYRDANAVRELEQFSHLWLVWVFSESVRDSWSPTVRPPRLGGNRRIGVFATRSPFRPNPIGLSCVRLEGIRMDRNMGPVLELSCADLMDGTPILDIKPYIPYADCHPDAAPGYTAQTLQQALPVEFPDVLMSAVPVDKREALIGILKQDPRPAYQDDPERIYGFEFAGMEISFRVVNGVLIVTEVRR